MSSLIAWILRAIPFGTIIMYGALGETLTEKSGNLNLGVPGIMYLGGFAGFASAYYYEKLSANPSAFVCVILALLCALIASALGGLIYAFLTITLRANQNVTGLALTTFGMGVANFFGVFILNGASYTAAPLAYKAFSAMIPVLSGLGVVGKVLFSYGFLAYAAIVLAVVLHWFFPRPRAGLNLRAVGETPATADAAGINVTLYKYVATCTGAAICGVGGLYYVLDYNQGIWATTGQIEALGWLAVALVIFTTWKPLNAIWGAYLFGVLYWLYQFLPSLLGITVASYMTDLIQMLPYVVTIVVLIVVSLRKKKENQPPEHVRTEPVSQTAPQQQRRPAGRRCMYISILPGEQVEVALTNNGVLEEYYLDMLHQKKIKGADWHFTEGQRRRGTFPPARAHARHRSR